MKIFIVFLSFITFDGETIHESFLMEAPSKYACEAVAGGVGQERLNRMPQQLQHAAFGCRETNKLKFYPWQQSGDSNTPNL